jgi:hypothetical protein
MSYIKKLKNKIYTHENKNAISIYSIQSIFLFPISRKTQNGDQENI